MSILVPLLWLVGLAAAGLVLLTFVGGLFVETNHAKAVNNLAKRD